jgi:hypothetical protein
MSPEPEDLVLELLRGIRSEIAGIRREMVTKVELRSELNSLRATGSSGRAALWSSITPPSSATAYRSANQRTRRQSETWFGDKRVRLTLDF